MLSELWTAGIGRLTDIELLPSARVARELLDFVQVDVRQRARAMTEGNLAAPDHRIVKGLFDAPARGVSYQVIYGAQVLQNPAVIQMLRQCVDAGEQARVFPQVPLNVMIVDDRWALVSARTMVGEIAHTAAMVVHESPFLTGLVGIFDALWQVAVPVTGGTGSAKAIGAPALETNGCSPI
jgi:hypothetical protein